MRLDQVTVILPTRNEERNITAFCQSLPADVWLIVVDASEDATPDLVRRHRPGRTCVVCEPTNVVEARQIGARMAETEWLLFSDADVVFAPDYGERLAAPPRKRRHGHLPLPDVPCTICGKRAGDE